MKEQALILFFKNPEKGKVKIRLARELGDELVFELYGHFITDILEACSGVDSDTIISVSTDNCDISDTRFYPEYECQKQHGHENLHRPLNTPLDPAVGNRPVDEPDH